MAKSILSRRAVLRGTLAGGALSVMPLPRMAAMLNGNGTAYAAGEPLRRVYGTWFWANGVDPKRWTPATPGAGFPLSEQLMPFANIKRNLTVVSGMAVKTGRTGPHLYHAGALTGSAGASNKTADLPSIDQLIANKIGGETKFRSLEVGVCKGRPTATAPLYYNASWRAPGAPNPPEFDPHAIFLRLFGPGSPGAGLGGGKAPAAGPAPDNSGVQAVRKSVLDAITEDARNLSVRLGSEDRHRLDKHLDGIRTLEKRMFSGSAGSVTGCRPVADSGVAMDSKAEAPPELNKAMADLVVAALSCDLTRVFTFMFNNAGSHLYFRNLGPTMNKDFHTQICHAEGGEQPNFNIGVLYTMKCWAYLLEEMDKVQEGAGTLLDNAIVYGSTCVSLGKNHSSINWPVIIAGRAGGALKGDMHVKMPPEDNVTKVAFTIGNVFGLNLTEMGKDAGRATEEVPGIRA